MAYLQRLFREFCSAGYGGCRTMRRRSRGNPARPYIWRLTVVIFLLTVPSTLPELRGRVRALRTASLPLRIPLAKERSSGRSAAAASTGRGRPRHAMHITRADTRLPVVSICTYAVTGVRR